MKSSQKAVQEYVRARRKVTILFFLGLSTVSLMLVFYIYQYMQMLELQLAIAKLQKERHALQEQIEVKQAEREREGRLERVEEIATRKLGMGLPAKEQMWYIPVTSAPGER